MNTLTCCNCGRDFSCLRKRKYCSKRCKDRQSHGIGPDSQRVRELSELRELEAAGLRRCTKCKTVKPIELFNRCVSRSGKATPRCKTCINEDKRNHRVKSGGTPREELGKRGEARRLSAKARRRHRVWASLWLFDDRSEAERYRDRYRNDVQFQTKEKMRRQLNKAAKRDGVAELIRGAINRGGKSSKVEALLGYDIPTLMRHIEKQFTKGMTWDMWMAGQIHLDHIIPQKSFDLSDEQEWRECWSLSNLQPLWAKDNLKKSARVEKLL